MDEKRPLISIIIPAYNIESLLSKCVRSVLAQTYPGNRLKIIIVDDNSSINYIEGCTAPLYSNDSLHASVVEIFVGKNSTCRYTAIQNWSNNVYNLVTKRAICEENALMEWVDGNIGSKYNMKYPSVILKGQGSKGTTISIAVANNQIQDAGAKMIHLAPNTSSKIISKAISKKRKNSVVNRVRSPMLRLSFVSRKMF